MAQSREEQYTASPHVVQRAYFFKDPFLSPTTHPRLQRGLLHLRPLQNLRDPAGVPTGVGGGGARSEFRRRESERHSGPSPSVTQVSPPVCSHFLDVERPPLPPSPPVPQAMTSLRMTARADGSPPLVDRCGSAGGDAIGAGSLPATLDWPCGLLGPSPPPITRIRTESSAEKTPTAGVVSVPETRRSPSPETPVAR